MIPPLLARAILAPPLRATPMTLWVLTVVLDGQMGAHPPQLVKVGAIARRLCTDRATVAHALAILVREGYLHLHGRTPRRIGWYTLGNGQPALTCESVPIVPRLENAA